MTGLSHVRTAEQGGTVESEITEERERPTPMTALLALERLEGRVQQALDQLRASRAANASARAEVEALQEKIADRDRQIDDLGAQLAEQEGRRDVIRQRIQTLLDRFGDLESGA